MPGEQLSSSAPSPARWAAAGALGGASVVGMLWALLGRAPLCEAALGARLLSGV